VPVAVDILADAFTVSDASLVSHLVAFAAGVLSFLTPCVLPLLPGYLSFVSGVGIDDLGSHSRKVGIASFAFTLGIVFSYVVQGAAAGRAGQFFDIQNFLASDAMRVIAGVVLVVFGVLTLDIIRISWLMRERRFKLKKPASFVGILLAGVVFAIGLGPCTTFLYASVISLAIAEGNPVGGASLMFAYGLGIGVPFVASGFLFTYLIGTFSAVKRHFRAIRIISGGLLILFGLLLASGELTEISRWLQNVLPSIDV